MKESRPIVVLVTGCSQGIGEATCHALLQRGNQVLGLDIKAPSSALAEHPNFQFENVDLTQEGMYDRWLELFNTYAPDAVVHSAGMGTMGQFGEIPRERERFMVKLNVLATLDMVHAAVAIARGDKSLHLVLLSSTAGISCVPGMAVYSASKHFVSGLALSVHEEVQIRGLPIQISTLTPPPVRTKFRENMGFEERKKRITGVLMPEEVAADVLHVLKHPQQSRITGLMHRLSFKFLRHLLPKRFLHRKIYEASLFDLQPLKPND